MDYIMNGADKLCIKMKIIIAFVHRKYRINHQVTSLDRQEKGNLGNSYTCIYDHSQFSQIDYVVDYEPQRR